MPSLTPQHRYKEAQSAAINDGVFAAICGIIPSAGAVYLGMRSPAFVKATNYQSRTALVIMPPLFLYAYASEQKLNHKMIEIANETEHSRDMAQWAHQRQQQAENSKVQKINKDLTKDANNKGLLDEMSSDEVERQLLILYKQSVKNSGVRIVSGDHLSFYHHLSNFWQENPFKILGAMGAPAVAYIFLGRNQQQHLQLQSKIMHTRVYGQFTVLAMLMGLMGFKAYMDKMGKFITEAEAQRQVDEMQMMKRELMLKLENDRQVMEERGRLFSRQPGEGKKKKDLELSKKEVNHLIDPFEEEGDEEVSKKKKKTNLTESKEVVTSVGNNISAAKLD